MEELAICSRPDLVNWLQSMIRVSPLRESPNTKSRTDGSKSTKMDRGTYFPLPVSVKKVSKEPPSAASLASGSGRPSAFRPCSRRYLRNKLEPIMLPFLKRCTIRKRNWFPYSSQALLPSWVPAWPIWRWQIYAESILISFRFSNASRGLAGC